MLPTSQTHVDSGWALEMSGPIAPGMMLLRSSSMGWAYSEASAMGALNCGEC